ncbi:hypothetical protein U1Q18_033084, partial [Sarracenia purpurea var. burkii]
GSCDSISIGYLVYCLSLDVSHTHLLDVRSRGFPKAGARLDRYCEFSAAIDHTTLVVVCFGPNTYGVTAGSWLLTRCCHGPWFSMFGIFASLLSWPLP